MTTPRQAGENATEVMKLAKVVWLQWLARTAPGSLHDAERLPELAIVHAKRFLETEAGFINQAVREAKRKLEEG